MKKQNHGFTIIEVMIVLAIAATIMAVVFLGVQSLQRSQRTNKSVTSAGRIISTIQDYKNSTSKALDPGSITGADKTQIQNLVASFTSGSGDAPVYTGVAAVAYAPGTAGHTNETILYSIGMKCVNTGFGPVITDGNANKSTIAVIWYSESAGHSVCKDSEGNSAS